jgi:hypothetical protein
MMHSVYQRRRISLSGLGVYIGLFYLILSYLCAGERPLVTMALSSLLFLCAVVFSRASCPFGKYPVGDVACGDCPSVSYCVVPSGAHPACTLDVYCPNDHILCSENNNVCPENTKLKTLDFVPSVRYPPVAPTGPVHVVSNMSSGNGLYVYGGGCVDFSGSSGAFARFVDVTDGDPGSTVVSGDVFVDGLYNGTDDPMGDGYRGAVIFSLKYPDTYEFRQLYIGSVYLHSPGLSNNLVDFRLYGRRYVGEKTYRLVAYETKVYYGMTLLTVRTAYSYTQIWIVVRAIRGALPRLSMYRISINYYVGKYNPPSYTWCNNLYRSVCVYPYPNVALRSCPPGFTQNASGACFSCPNGSFCPGYTETYRNCSAGYYCTTPASEEPCPPSYFCAVGAVVPLLCPQGFYCPGSKTIDPVPCVVSELCPAGLWRDALCPVGMSAESVFDPCSVVSAGYVYNASTLGIRLCGPYESCEGLWRPAISCANGTYPSDASDGCRVVPRGYEFNATARKIRKCGSLEFCAGGWVAGVPCANGTYSVNATQPCHPVSPGYEFRASTGAIRQCYAGEYCVGGWIPAVSCVNGTYNTNATQPCQAVLSGYEYLPSVGAIRPCYAGEYCAGGWIPAVSCANGTYNTNATQPCQPVPSGYEYLVLTRAIRQCYIGEYCAGGWIPAVPCANGTYNANATQPCQPVLSGYEYLVLTRTVRRCTSREYCAGGWIPAVPCANGSYTRDGRTPCSKKAGYSVYVTVIVCVSVAVVLALAGVAVLVFLKEPVASERDGTSNLELGDLLRGGGR